MHDIDIVPDFHIDTHGNIRLAKLQHIRVFFALPKLETCASQLCGIAAVDLFVPKDDVT
jgi:hypothetical protein